MATHHLEQPALREHLELMGLTAERAIQDRETGRIHTEWSILSRKQILEIINSAPGGPERYALVVRYVTPWEVEP